MPGEITISTKTQDREFINIIEEIPEEKLEELGIDTVTAYNKDLESRDDWEAKRNRWYKLWALYRENKTEPWPGCSNVCIPLLATACNQFHGRAYQSVFSAPEIMHALPTASNDVVRAKNVERYMNWQLRHEMIEFEQNFDKLLLNLPIYGIAFEKTMYSKSLERPVTSYISATDMVLPYRTTQEQFDSGNVAVIQRIWLNWDQMLDRREKGIYKFEDDDIMPEASDERKDEQLQQTADEVAGETANIISDDPHLILERHVYLNLGDGRKPYVVTVHKTSQKVLRITSRIIKIRAEKKILNFFTDYHFIPNPEGFYSFGFGHFLETINEMSNTALNQIFDSGRLSNQPFFFCGRRPSFKKLEMSLHPGKGIEVDDPSQIVFPQMQRVDSVLFNVLGLLQGYAASFTSVTENLLGREQAGVERPTARGTLALIEQGLTTFSILVKRIYRSMSKELTHIKLLNEIFLPDTKEYRVSGSSSKIAFSDIKKEDFGGKMDIVPVADPSFSSKQIRRQEAIQLHQITMTNPLIVGSPPPKEGGEPAIKPNLRAMFETTRNLYAAFDEPHTQNLLTAIEEAIPPESIDPDEENAMFMQGDRPTPTQQDDHAIHLQVHEFFSKTDAFREMPSEYKDAFAAHIEATIALAQIQAEMAQQQAVQAPATVQ
jgi:hypothetical protein